MSRSKKVRYSINLLRYTYVVFLVLISLDKLLQTNIIGVWSEFVGPATHTILPFASTIQIVFIEGTVEMLIALFLLTRWVRVATCVLLVATFVVWIDLFTLGFYNLALRDVLFGVGTIVLILLLGE